MPPQRRRPATPPTRRPKVAGLSRRTDAAEETPEVETPEVEQQVTDTEPAPAESVPARENGRPRPSVKKRDSGALKPEGGKHRIKPDPASSALLPTAPPASEADAVAAKSKSTPAASAPASTPVAKPDSAAAKSKSAQAAESDVDEADLQDPELEESEFDLTGFEPGEPLATETGPAEPSYILPIALVVAALLIAGLGYWFTMQYPDTKVGKDNSALVDVEGTKNLVGAAQEAVVNALSYKFDELDKARTRAGQYLTGEAVDQYNQTMKAIEADIQKQKLQVAVNPTKVAVVRLAGDDARVLVYADQIGVREDKQPAGGPTQFALDMRRVDGKWKITRLDFFDGKPK